MLRGYRSIIVAFGLMLISVIPTGQRSYARQAENQQKDANPLERIANAVDEANKPKRETAECPEGGNDRKSDLCAQWKAADAAKQAADAADSTVTIGWAGVALGAITMLAAIAAAIYARSAANHTRDGNTLIRDEQRPWIAINAVPGSAMLLHNGNADLSIDIDLKNCGRRVATDLIIAGKMFTGALSASDFNDIVTQLREKVRKWQDEPDYNRRIVLPGQIARCAQGLECPPIPNGIYRIVVYLEYKIEGLGQFKHSWSSFDLYRTEYGQPQTIQILNGRPLLQAELILESNSVGGAD